ncbi:MAG: hypothetical protein K2Q18_04110 [Bdellovibrionales bacterium]|nr:hypothetical protein [Bdellovibrionales bacterium]
MGKLVAMQSKIIHLHLDTGNRPCFNKLMKELTLDEIQKILHSDHGYKDLEILWKDPTRGNLYKCVGPKKQKYWIVQTPLMIGVFPAEDEESEVWYSPLKFIVEEVSHRVRYCETLNINPSKVKGLHLTKDATFENAKEAVEYLDAWRLNDSFWKDDPELQRMRTDYAEAKSKKK